MLNFNKNNVSRGTVANGCFTWNKGGDMLKRFKLNFLHCLTKIIWWFRKFVISLHRVLETEVKPFKYKSYDKITEV